MTVSFKPSQLAVAPDRSSTPRPLLFFQAGLLLVVCMLLVAILVRNGGHFAYTLDAPYTHLSLAEQILRGTYGLNPGEPAFMSQRTGERLEFAEFYKDFAWVTSPERVIVSGPNAPARAGRPSAVRRPRRHRHRRRRPR